MCFNSDNRSIIQVAGSVPAGLSRLIACGCPDSACSTTKCAGTCSLSAVIEFQVFVWDFACFVIPLVVMHDCLPKNCNWNEWNLSTCRYRLSGLRETSLPADHLWLWYSCRLCYQEAFSLMHRHRINMNLICDHNRTLFLSNIQQFIEQMASVNQVNQFIADLQ